MWFPFVLVDEACQATEPAVICALARASKQVVLVGDPMQLPCVVKCPEARRLGMLTSLFEQLAKKKSVPLHMLKIQYRMLGFIRKWPSMAFYDDLLQDGDGAGYAGTSGVAVVEGFPWPLDRDGVVGRPVAFVDVRDSHESRSHGRSRENEADEAEVRCVQRVVAAMLGGQQGEDNFKLGVISFYSAQVGALQKALRAAPDVEVSTVDGFQGREKDVIIISCVRSNAQGDANVGFLGERRRLNVALTRARRGLVVVGNSATLRHDRNWREWLAFVEKESLFVDIPAPP